MILRNSLFIYLLGSSLFSFAQSSPLAQPNIFGQKPARAASSDKGWSNIMDELSLVNLNFISNASLFPDSTVKQLYPGPVVGGKPTFELGNTYLHAAGQIIDPKFFNNPVHVSPFNPYTLDSVALYFRYLRNVNVADTLLIQVYDDKLVERYNILDPDGAVKDKCGRIAYDPATHLPVKATKTIKYVLGQKDATTGFTYEQLSIPVQLEIPANGIAAVIFSFIPGYPWHAGDTLEQSWTPAPVHKMNQFLISTFNDIGKQKLKLYSNGIFMTTQFLSNPVAWNNFLIPGNIYDDAFRYTTVDYHISVVNSSVHSQQLEASALYPNPALINEPLFLQWPKVEEGNLEIVRMDGTVLSTNNINLSEANQLLNPAWLPKEKGLYLLRITTPSATHTRQFLLQ